jgi:hypothetical protein
MPASKFEQLLSARHTPTRSSWSLRSHIVPGLRTSLSGRSRAGRHVSTTAPEH